MNKPQNPAQDPAEEIRQLQLTNSELQRALAQALHSEQRYRSLIDYAKIGYATFNEFGEHLSTNPAYCEILGVSEEDLLGQGLGGFLDEQSREVWARAVESPEHAAGAATATTAATGEKVLSVQLRVVRPSGEMVPCLVYASPIQLPGGAGYGHFASFSDITVLSKREAAIREREGQIRTLVEALGDGIVELDLHGRIHFANAAAERLLEVSVDEMRGKFYTGILRLCQDSGVPLRPEENPVALSLVRGEPASAQHFVHSSAGIRSLDISVMPLFRDEFKMGVVLVFRDVSEIQALSADFLSILDNSGDSMFIKDLQGRYRVVNQQFAHLHGFSHWRDMVGKSDFDLHPREVAEAFWKEDLEVIESGQALNGIIRPYIGVLGDQRYGRSSKRPYFNARGRIVGLFGVSSDITDLKNLNDQLSKAKEQAESATQAKSLFLASMSHEIRTPLNAVIGLSMLLGRTKLDAKQRDYLEKIEAAGKTLGGVINDILDLSKIEAGRLELESVSLSLAEVVAGARALIQERCEEAGLELIVDLDASIPDLLVGDPLRITQVLMNLLSNAVKFTEKGSIKLGARLQSRQGSSCSIRFEVSDSGIGIEPEDLPKLFQNFSQVDPSVSRKFGGTGLGLSITKHLVEMHGGEISVDSVPGQGTTFTFTVQFGIAQDGPHLQQSSEAAYQRLSAQLQASRQLRVLIIEDNEVNRLILEESLAAEGIACLAADGALEGIRMLEQSTLDGIPVDLIFMDLQMPEVDGFSAARKIRAERAWAQIPILAISADVFDHTLVRIKAAGMNALLAKPIAINEILEAVLHWTSVHAKMDKIEELPALEEGDSSATRSAATINDTGPLLPTIEGLDIASALRRIRGNRSLYERLLLSFVASYQPDRITALKNAKPENRKDLDWLAEFAHSLRGAASNLGANRLSQIAGQLQQAARSADSRLCRLLKEELELRLDSLVQGIRGWLDEKLEASNPAAESEQRTSELNGQSALILQALIGFLIQNDSRAGRLARELQADLAPGPQKMLAEQIVAACDNFDYATSLDLVQQLQ